METVNWTQLSELGLLQRINREILHPVGLSASRNPENGHSEVVYVADDGVWDYDDTIKNVVLTKEEIQEKLKEWGKM